MFHGRWDVAREAEAVTVASLLSAAAARHHDRPAIEGVEQTITYGQLAQITDVVAARLCERGHAPGDRIALVGTNCPEWVVAFFAAMKAGLVTVPLNSRLHPDEIRYVLQHSGARTLLIDRRLASASAIADRAAEETTILTMDELTSAQTPIGTITGGASPADPAWLFYTSGTTGRPKGAILTHANLLAMTVGCLADMCDFNAADVALHIAPLSHGSGLYLLPAIAAGATNVLLETESLDARNVLATIERRRATVIPFAAPTSLLKLLDHAASATADTSSLRCVIYGGAPMHEASMHRLLDRFGPIFVQLYGQGETPMTATYLPAAAHVAGDDGTSRSILRSVGWARTGVDVDIRTDRGASAAADEIGEIVVRGPTVMTGYWNDPEATTAAIDNGWLRTGDIGMRDRRGLFFLLDRAKDMIISGGNNVYAREVEDVILQMEGVSGAAVVGVPDAYWGERVHAVVVVDGASVTEAEVIEHCRDRLASYKKPSSVSLAHDLPVNAHGKVLKRELRARLSRSSTSTAAGAAMTVGRPGTLPDRRSEPDVSPLSADRGESE